jgi:hypothetical protein
MTTAILRVVGRATRSPGSERGDAETFHGAIEEAKRKAEAGADAVGRRLGDLLEVEEIRDSSATLDSVVALVRVTYALERIDPGGARDLVAAGIPGSSSAEDLLEYVTDEYRGLYGEYRRRLLEGHPELSSRPAPLRRGRRRYEGFRLGGRNVIYASFKQHGVRLMFELPKGHGLPESEFETRGRRDWRALLLDSPYQLEGALLLAEDTIDAFSR